jgi:PAS domain S-box-containing protein
MSVTETSGSIRAALEPTAQWYDELRQSEEKFRLLVESVKDYAIFMLDPKGHVLTWNLGAERIKGYRQDEIVGRHFSVFYPVEDVQSGKPDRGLVIAAAEGRFEDEGWRVRKDGSRFWANVVITALRDHQGNLEGFGKVTRDVTERKQAEQALSELSAQLLSSQDEERRRLARELHDSSAQTLAALSINLELVGKYADISGDPRASKALAASVELAAQVSCEIRTFAYLLHPPDLEEAGLCSALSLYVKGFAQRTNVEVDLEISPGLDRLSDDVEIALFRIAQECLTNVHRHSGSRRARIRLVRDPGQITLEVADDGKGLPASSFTWSDGTPVTLGVGIRGMRERVKQLGGRLQVEPVDPGNPTSPGTHVSVVLPVR